jgi:hypothetical protein
MQYVKVVLINPPNKKAIKKIIILTALKINASNIVVNTLSSYSEGPGSNLSPGDRLSPWIFICGFLQSLQVNAGIVP